MYGAIYYAQFGYAQYYYAPDDDDVDITPQVATLPLGQELRTITLDNNQNALGLAVVDNTLFLGMNDTDIQLG